MSTARLSPLLTSQNIPPYLKQNENGSFSISSKCALKDEDLIELATRTDLWITDCFCSFSHVSLSTLLLFLDTHGKEIHHFTLIANTAEFAENMRDIFLRMPNMQSLEISCQRYLSNIAVQEALTQCPQLARVSLLSNRHITQSACSAFKEHPTRRFSQLTLGASEWWSRVDLADNQAHSLTLTGPHFTDGGLKSISNQHELSILRLNQTAVSVEAIVDFFRSHPKTETIHVNNSSPLLCSKKATQVLQLVQKHRIAATVTQLPGSNEFVLSRDNC